MFDSREELLQKIRLGEDSLIELKEVCFAGGKVVAPNRESLGQELAAFANSHGGVCVLGIEDTSRDVQNFTPEELDAIEAFVRQECFDAVRPAIFPRIEKLILRRLDGTTGAVIRIDVPKSLWVHETSGGCFHRVGRSNRPMSREFLDRLFQQRSQARLIRFDEQVVPGIQFEDLDQSLWQRFQIPSTKDDSKDLLAKLGMMRSDETGGPTPTVAGVLLATNDPRKWMPSAFIQAVAYSGSDSVPTEAGHVYQLDAQDISGALDQQILGACRFVARNMRVAATKDLGRRDLPQYDLTSVFEAVVNAVAHRDYAVYGSKIRLRLFSDRLELYSPGAISNTMTVDSLPYRQSARNETITSLLAKIPVPVDLEPLKTDRRTLMDKRGEGVRIILENSEKLSGRRPVYRLIDDAELLLTIFAANP